MAKVVIHVTAVMLGGCSYRSGKTAVAPVEGRDYPGSMPELRVWIRSDDDCVDYLDLLCRPDGFVCPWCAGVGDGSTSPGMHRCSDCGRWVSVISGTVSHRAMTPLTVWFEVA